MILGVGTDLCDIRRIEKTLVRFGARFTDRVYTDIERRRAERRHGPAARYAQYYAAKEACAKALGTGFRMGVFWRDLGVEHLPTGQPYLVIEGGAMDRLLSLTPPGMAPRIDLSLTDEYPYAHAMVVISADPAGVRP